MTAPRLDVFRRSGLDGPTAIILRSDIFKTHWYATSDLKAPTYGNHDAPRLDVLRRSGLYGPTAIILRSDIFKTHWYATSDLKAPTYKNHDSPEARCLP